MPRHDLRVTLQQMREHAVEAIELLRGRSRAELDEDRLLGLAVTRLVEVVGEAAARCPANERQRYPAIPWSEIIAMRNRLIHGYDQVDLGILWQVVCEDLPPLVDALGRILADELGC